MNRFEYAAWLREESDRLLTLAATLEKPVRTALTTRVNTCTCDSCGDQIRGLNWIGRFCEAALPTGRCHGQYRLDPEPVAPDLVRTSDGRTLPVTVERLAAENAIEDAVDLFASGDDSDDPATWPSYMPSLDIASTYGGRHG